jgi:hypothetical protein
MRKMRPKRRYMSSRCTLISRQPSRPRLRFVMVVRIV